MMRVIKAGDWKKRHTCKNCKTKFEYNKDDIRYGFYSEEYEDLFEGRFYVGCPECGKPVFQKHIPESLAMEIKENRAD